MINGCERGHFAAFGDFRERLAFISEGRNREKRAHEDKLLIPFQNRESMLREIWNELDRNAALSSGWAAPRFLVHLKWVTSNRI